MNVEFLKVEISKIEIFENFRHIHFVFCIRSSDFLMSRNSIEKNPTLLDSTLTTNLLYSTLSLHSHFTAKSRHYLKTLKFLTDFSHGHNIYSSMLNIYIVHCMCAREKKKFFVKFIELIRST
jgi:hypothetical protein